ncbi:MAG: FG-GAP repeat protein [Acidobacteriota bacterium]|nr:FG-GAP repeat protein [Acidobacteriota bacterium]
MSLSFNRPIRPLVRHRSWLALLCVVAVAATSSLPLRHTSTMAAGQKPRSASGNVAAEPQTEMPADLREAVERSRYRISEQESAALPGSYQAMNPAQAFSATFTDAGLRVQPHSASVKAESADFELTASAVAESAQAEAVAGWQWGMTLRGYGYGEQMQEVAPAALAAADNRIEYRRGEMTEWYVNDQRGLEQGFTLAARPAGSKGREPLVVRLSVEGDLRAEGSRDNQHIYFVGEDGARVLSYSGLVAFDARGKALAAQMRVAEGEVRLEVEDEGAEYPLTIDPLIALETKLTASDGATNDAFGISVAISGDTAVVGSRADDTAAGQRAGSAYVFVRSNGVWSQQAKLTASDAAEGDWFGYSVAINSGITIVVGAPTKHMSSGGFPQGAAYVFVRSNGVWSQQAKLTASDAADQDGFGNSVAISSGNTIVVGADSGDTAAGQQAGSAYVFVRSNGVWNQQAKLTASDTADGDFLGTSVAISGNTIVAGAPGDDTAAGQQAGSAYVFVRSNGVWSQQAKLTASDATAEDKFGWSVAITGGTAVVGAYDDHTAAGDGAGSAYVFVRTNEVWSQQAKLTASDATAEDRFGWSVAITGDTIVVGAPSDTLIIVLSPTTTPVPFLKIVQKAGSAYVFGRSNGQWSQQVKLTASDAAKNDWFGYSVAISGDNILVGAPSPFAHTSAGSAYVKRLINAIPL